MVAIGVAVAFLANLAVPVLLAVRWGRHNHRVAENRGSEQVFWLGLCIYLAALLVSAVATTVGALAYNGVAVIFQTIVTLPMSLIPAGFDSTVIHLLITRSQWANGAYEWVMPTYLFGCVAWTALLPIGIRRLVLRRSSVQRRERALATP